MLPNFLIIGAAKAGTTAVYNYLQQHPEVYMSPLKEPHFFSYMGRRPDCNGPGDAEGINEYAITDLSSYERLFEGARGFAAVGEGSVSYLYSHVAPTNIADVVPRGKLIVLLRDPTDRAYSSYLYMRARGREPLNTFEEALEAENDRIRNNWQHIWHYRQMGFYAEQLGRYLDTFQRDQILISLYEDFISDPQGVLSQIFEFLEVDSGFEPDRSFRPNPSGVPRNPALYRLYGLKNPMKMAMRAFLSDEQRERLRTRFNRWSLERPDLRRDTRADLVSGYRDDILILQELLGRDLSSWLR